jgi:mannose-6-phosphate isomerase-like protein (cupin superfamily)
MAKQPRAPWLLPLIFLATPASAQAPPAAAPVSPGQTAFVAGRDLQAEIAAVSKEVKPGGFLWRPVLRGGVSVAALEVWTSPRPPAIHPDEAEYAMVVAGSGTLVSGGTMVGPHLTKPGLVEGERIEGGTSRELRTGDVFMVAPGVPHWFAVHGDRMVLLGTKLAQPK